MECKYYPYSFTKNPFRELIDTLWNVNTRLSSTRYSQATRINRYIMECKLYYELNEEQIIDRINRYIMECKFV